MLLKYGILGLAGMAAWGLNLLLLQLAPVWTDITCAALVFGWLAAFFLIRRRTAVINLLLALNFVIALIFALKLPFHFKMHDLAGYAPGQDGHLGYIAWIAQYGTLPNLNPAIEGQTIYVHPPLSHILQAGFLNLNTLLGCEWWQALELGQVLTLVCGVACTFAVVDLLKTLGISEEGIQLSAVFMLFQPILLILGCVLNNDILAILCSILCLLFTIRWHRSRRLRDILFIAISLAAGMATKLSSALVIPCIAVLFAADFFRDLKRWKQYIKQFSLFLLVCVPLSIAWPLYQLIVHQIPLNHVRLPIEQLSIASKTLWQRFGFPELEALKKLFYKHNPDQDYNFWLLLLKTGAFDEFELFFGGTTMWYVSYLMMAAWGVMMVCAAVLFVRWVLKSMTPIGEKGFLLGFGMLLLIYFVKFCLDYPYVCTPNMRYIAPVLALGAIGVGYAVDTLKHARWLRRLVCSWAGLVCVVYAAYFFTNGLF